MSTKLSNCCCSNVESNKVADEAQPITPVKNRNHIPVIELELEVDAAPTADSTLSKEFTKD